MITMIHHHHLLVIIFIHISLLVKTLDGFVIGKSLSLIHHHHHQQQYQQHGRQRYFGTKKMRRQLFHPTVNFSTNYALQGILWNYAPPIHCRFRSTTTSTMAMRDDENDNNIHDGTSKRSSVVIVGSGAVGCFYGAKLWETGRHDVTFVMRGEHLTKCQQSGLHLSSIDGDIHIPPSSQTFIPFPSSRATKTSTADWILLCLKSTGMSSAPSLLQPFISPQKTRIMAIMNGMVDDDLVDSLRIVNDEGSASTDCSHRRLSCAAVYGGMALLCSNRIGHGHVDHSYAGELVGAIAATTTETTTEEDRMAMEDLWRGTDISFKFGDSLTRGRWVKNCWNLPFNSVSVAMNMTVDKICKDEGLRWLADKIMDETIDIANADLRERGELKGEDDLLGDKEKEKMWSLSDNMGPYKTSTFLDFTFRRPMEVQYLFRKPLDRAKELGVSAPHLEVVVTQIEALQRMYNLF